MFKKNILNAVLCGCASASVAVQDDVGGEIKTVSALDRLRFLFGSINDVAKEVNNDESVNPGSNGRKLLRAHHSRGLADVKMDIEDDEAYGDIKLGVFDDSTFPQITDYNDLGFSLEEVAIDVISIGSVTRADYLKAQATTWASHVSIRHFWGITEIDDLDNECASMTPEELSTHVQTCKSMHTSDPLIDDFVAKFYGMSEGGRSRIDDKGWICAQRRIGRAFAWLQSQYLNSVDAPDFLIIVDDDTLLNMSTLQSFLQKEQERMESRPMCRAGCLFRENYSSIPWTFPYGGFGTFLNKKAVLQLIQPISCDVGQDVMSNRQVCHSIEQNRLGEYDLFEDGMSVFAMFSKYSTLKDFCMHSDWLIGYIVKFYLKDDIDEEYEMVGMENYPFCGNFTFPHGAVRQCKDKSAACHNQKPKDMESIVLSSYVRSPLAYKAVPILTTTDEEESKKLVEEKKSEVDQIDGKILLPNVHLIGAQKSGTTAIAEWLFSNGVCSAEVFDNEPKHYNKEVHFFDDINRYEQGVEFYTKRFEHCAQEGNTKFIMDATPATLMESQRVYSLYNQVPGDLSTSLKLIVILREPISRELSLYNHKVYKFAGNQDTSMWYSDVIDANGTVMSFEEYAESVLRKQLANSDWKSPGKYFDHLQSWMALFRRDQLLILHYDEVKMNPEKVQWRIQEFLGATFMGNLPIANEQDMSKKRPVPLRAYEVLEPLFRRKNEELYHLIATNTGPWMEQRPFPHFENAYKRFAYVTVLGRNPNQSQNQIYVDAVRVLVRSLRSRGTDADIVILMLYEDETIEASLQQENALIKHINPIEQSRNVEQFEQWFVDIALSKLRTLQLTQYKRVQFIDADIAIEQNLDQLFEYNPNVKLVSEGLGMDSPLRAGWFMIKPSDADFQAIERIVKRGNFDENLGWDHLNLPCEYPGWQPSDAAKRWEFYGSQLEQGLLFHYFYALPKSNTPSENDFDLLTLLDDEELTSHGIVHFYGNRKPWGPPSDSLPLNVKAARSRWLQVYDKIRSTPEDFSSEVLSPLTDVGTSQYSKIRVLYAYGNQTLSTVKTPGGISMSDDFCSRPRSDQIVVSSAVAATIQDTACSTPSCHAEITSVCGAKVGRRLLPTRRLLDQSWQIEYLVTETFICEDATCSSPNDVATVAAIAHSVSTKVIESIGNGSFITSVESHISLQSTNLDESFFACLVVWGTVSNPESEVDGSGGDVSTSTESSFYPDWKYNTGTCLNDGNEPTYMKINKAWVSESLEKCCSRFYSGWNYSKCMNLQGSGLWYVSHLNGKCVTDCVEGNGPTCGGLANPTSDTLYSNPKSCCESELSYQLAEFCEATSLGSTCYAGTGLYYRGDTAGKEVCVRDCNQSSGDSTCGGLVKESNIILHETAKACCASQYSWIDVELCSARSTETPLEKYWPDKSDSKCRKDSEAPTSDLSVQIYDTAEECCTSGIFWLSKDTCLAASDVISDSGTEATGSNKFYVDWIKGQCVKDCVGPAPCGGLAQSWDPLYDSGTICCTRIPHVPDDECIFS